MAGSARELKKRIKVVKSTQQITKAMKMVAAAKLKVAQTKIDAAAPYTDKMQEILNNLLKAADNLSHPLTETRAEVEKICLIAYTSDRGLCGSFNSNLIRKAQTFVNEMTKQGKEVSIFPIGRRSLAFFTKNGYKIVDSQIGLKPQMSFANSKAISERVKALYTGGQFDAIYFSYPRFKNIVTSIPTTFQFLPLEPKAASSDGPVSSQTDYIFEPAADQLFNTLIPRYVDMQFFRLLIESMTSEYAAQMTAMTAATDNASEVIRSLSIVYNKVRQGSITAELLDIVGGVNALEG